jgi:thiosulfate dehydrogenase
VGRPALAFRLARLDGEEAMSAPASIKTLARLGVTLALFAAGAALAQQPAPAPSYTPPARSEIADDAFGKLVKQGELIFLDTAAQLPAYVGNRLRCASCHMDDGRHPDSAPMGAAYLIYPMYRAKEGEVVTFQQRLQGCFRYSMNGVSPPLGDPALKALEAYAFFLARGAPVGVKVKGQGYPRLKVPASFDRAKGKAVYEAKCALCHGADGQGQEARDGQLTFPPLWGPQSYNWGAGMSQLQNASAFIKANMPLGMGNTLTDEEAWNVAAYIDTRERPQDPRFNGSVEETRKNHHDSPLDFYGTTVDGVTLGAASVPSGGTTRK